jgi:hypothetical protein
MRRPTAADVLALAEEYLARGCLLYPVHKCSAVDEHGNGVGPLRKEAVAWTRTGAIDRAAIDLTGDWMGPAHAEALALEAQRQEQRASWGYDANGSPVP